MSGKMIHRMMLMFNIKQQANITKVEGGTVVRKLKKCAEIKKKYCVCFGEK